MAKIDTSTIEGYAEMTADQKVAALEALTVPDAVDLSQYVSKATFDKKATEAAESSRQLKALKDATLTEEERFKAEKAEFENVFRKDKTDDHRNNSHDNTVNEIHGVKVCDKFSTAGDTCANEEKYKTKLSEKLKCALRGHNAYLTKTTEMSEHKAHKKASASCCK